MPGQVRAYTNILALHNVNCLSDSYLIARKPASMIHAFTQGRLLMQRFMLSKYYERLAQMTAVLSDVAYNGSIAEDHNEKKKHSLETETFDASGGRKAFPILC